MKNVTALCVGQLTTLHRIACTGRLSVLGIRSTAKGACPKKPLAEVSTHVATTYHSSSMITSGPTAHWVGSETLVGLQVEGREVLADSGSQVNTVMPSYVHQHEFPVLPLCDLVDHPLNLVGLGSMRTHPLAFLILRVQVKEITGYDKDVVFLVVSDESEFSQCVPIMIGTCTLGRIINMIRRVRWTDF